MTATQVEALPALYERDETAWLDQMAELVREQRVEDLDLLNLSEFLSDMAKRDRREVESRLAVLLAHLLKWTYQPERRTGGWKATVEVQRHELELLLQSGTLRAHADESVASAYKAAVRQAVAETGLPAETFPGECPYQVDALVRLDQLPE
jgi:Domain of unknown function DUF29